MSERIDTDTLQVDDMHVVWPRAAGVQRQLLLPVVLPHLGMLPAILRMIVPAVSDESRARDAPGREPAAR